MANFVPITNVLYSMALAGVIHTTPVRYKDTVSAKRTEPALSGSRNLTLNLAAALGDAGHRVPGTEPGLPISTAFRDMV
jgi:hypothetical protein